jgi:GMP synthase (glutamine-hydrolysing)
MKKFLILQSRPEDEASDNELSAFMKFGKLNPEEIHRVRLERDHIPVINLDDYAGVLVGGGPNNVSDKHKSVSQQRSESELHALLDQIIARDFPYFGACYGLGLLAEHLGGAVSKEKYSEPVGAVTVKLEKEAKDDQLTADLPLEFRAFVGHKEACQTLPPNTVLLANSSTCPVQMIRLKQNIYATQFHPELDVDGITVRIRVYRHAGYFAPEDAEELQKAVQTENITVPMVILRRFIERYRLDT